MSISQYSPSSENTNLIEPYRQYLGQLSKAAAYRNAQRGVYSGKPLNGYCKVDWSEIHQVDERKRNQIARIFREAAKGRSYRQLLRICAEIGLTNASGGSMSLSSLHNLLTNPFYRGFITINGTLMPGNHEALCTVPKS